MRRRDEPKSAFNDDSKTKIFHNPGDDVIS